MGRLVIAHHKSYHPYRRDNVERVRRDEEEAQLKEEQEEGRMQLAVRIHLYVFNTLFLLSHIDSSAYSINMMYI
jgi:hypothetical protein